MTSALSSNELLELEEDEGVSNTSSPAIFPKQKWDMNKSLRGTLKIEDPFANSNDKILIFNTYLNYVWREPSVEDEIEQWPVCAEFQSYASDLCLEFCNSHGLTNILRLCIAKINEIFSNAATINVELDYFEDNDVIDEGHIVIRIAVGLDNSILMEKYNQIVDWFVDNIDADKQYLLVLAFE